MVHHQARIDMLQLEQSRLAAEFQASGQWDLEGFNSAYDWIRINCKVPGHVAGNYLAVGAHMAQLGQSVQAVLKDEISFAHRQVVAGDMARDFARSEEHTSELQSPCNLV